MYCQAQPQLNSTKLQLKLRLRLALIPLSPATQTPEKVVSKKVRLKNFSTPSQPQLNLNSTQPQLKLLSLALLSSSLFSPCFFHR